MLQYTELNLIQGEKGYTLLQPVQSQQAIEEDNNKDTASGGRRNTITLLFFSFKDSSSNSFLTLFLISDAAVLSFQWDKPKVWQYEWSQL